jgi:hypothetical protein
MMSDLERMKAQEEALDETAARSGTSADRARLWAGLNRYLGAEARHEHRVAEEERRHEAEAAAEKSD